LQGRLLVVQPEDLLRVVLRAEKDAVRISPLRQLPAVTLQAGSSVRSDRPGTPRGGFGSAARFRAAERCPRSSKARYTTGVMKRVRTWETTSPPTTARPSG